MSKYIKLITTLLVLLSNSVACHYFQTTSFRSKSSLNLITRLNTKSISSLDILGNHLYAVVYYPEELNGFGKVIDLDLNTGNIAYSSQPLKDLGQIHLFPEFIQVEYGVNAIYLDRNNFRHLPFDDTLYSPKPIFLTNQASYWLKKPDESSFYDSIVCLDPKLTIKWQFPRHDSSIKNGYPYPNIIYLHDKLHCFFNENNSIVHYSLETESGEIALRQVLFPSVRPIHFYPLDSLYQHTISPRWEEYESILTNGNNVLYISLSDNTIGIKTLQWSNQSLELVDEKKVNLAKSDSETHDEKIIIQNVFEKSNLLFIPVSQEMQDINTIKQSFQVYVFDIQQRKILGKVETPTDDKLFLDQIIIPDEIALSKQKEIHLILDDEFKGSKLFYSSYELKNQLFSPSVIQCFNLNSMKISFEHIINQEKLYMKYAFSRFWFYPKESYHRDPDTALPHFIKVYDEYWNEIAKHDLTVAYQDFHQSMEKYYQTFSFEILPIDQNEAIIATCNGYIYSWRILD